MEETLVLLLELDFFISLELLLDMFFFRSSRALKTEFVSNFNNAVMYYVVTRKIPRNAVRWEENRWYGIILDIGAVKGNIVDKI